MDQSTNSIALVSPKFFGFNKETAKSNQFSDSSFADKKNKNQSINIKELALKEFSNFKKDLEKYFTGPTAAAISSDPISTAKILTKFSKSNDYR